jgi:arylsulfatase A-like enzyme
MLSHGVMRVSPILLFLAGALVASAANPPSKPNIVFILADDLGYGELGCYGQKKFGTPNIDRLAQQGMRFTQFYAGSTVCAPSRSVLMTGQHLGHTRVRGNAGKMNTKAQMLQPGDTTIAGVLKHAGYATGLIGKWGLGHENDDGEPRMHGFDYYFGYLNQGHAHNHYPSYLWRNGVKVALPNDLTPVGDTPGMGYATKRVVYATDLFYQEAQEFIQKNKDKPFFLYLALTTPHANNERTRVLGDGNEVPNFGSYADKDWNDSEKAHASMIERLDRGVGEVMRQLEQLKLAGNTLIMFSSDNGPHREGGPKYSPEFFAASGPLRGIKRSLTDGGIRVPFIVSWPGKIKAGVVSNHVGYFGDMMATFCDLIGAKRPPNLDSISITPTLFGQGTQAKHEYLYWEFYEQGVSQAVLIEGRWKTIRLKTLTAPMQVYDLSNDINEQTDLAEKHPEIVKRAAEIMKTARHDNEFWKINAPTAAAP